MLDSPDLWRPVPNVRLWHSYLAYKVSTATNASSVAIKEILKTTECLCDALSLDRKEALPRYVNELSKLAISQRHFDVAWFPDGTRGYNEEDSKAHLLTAAAYFNCITLVKSLTEEEYKSSGSHLFKSAIAAAASRGHNEVVEYLLTKNSESITKSDGAQAAIRNGHLKTLNLVLDSQGGDFSPTHHLYRPSVTAGLLQNDPAIFQLVPKLTKIDMTLPFLSDKLHRAAYRGNSDLVTYLLEIGTPVNGDPKDGTHNPLSSAARKGHFGVVSILLKHGADPNRAFRQHPYPRMNALVCAARGGSLAIARLLLEHGAMANEGSVPAIYYALQQEDMGMFRLLRKHGALLSNLPSGFVESLREMGLESMIKLIAEESACKSRRERNGHSVSASSV
jgi:hypothetical protein